MKKILLTGHKAFPEIKYDATEACVEKFNGMIIGDKQIIGVALPNTSLSSFNMISELLSDNEFDSIISMGTLSFAKGIRFEKSLVNRRGAEGSAPIFNSPNAEPVYYSDLNLSLFVDLLTKNNIPAMISYAMNCSFHNELEYLVTKMLRENSKFVNIKNLFIHVPYIWDYQTDDFGIADKFMMNREQYYESIKLIVKNI